MRRSQKSSLKKMKMTQEQKQTLFEGITNLKKQKNAVILAHYYQDKDIQDIADYIGDSLGLAIEASKTDADLIVFAGVHFMAETAKLLNPERKVVLPDLDAGCSLADSCPPAEFKKFVEAHPDHKVVTYVNCTAEVKALSDIVCTSSNAVDIINSFPKDQKIIFAPDKNLGKYLIKETGRDLLLWEGTCIVHEAFSFDKLLQLIIEYPDAKVVAHPESEPHILEVAHYVGSTSKMINYIKTSADDTFIVGTEAGILHELSKQAPGKNLIPLPIHEDNTCACSECAFMKVNTLQKLYNCMLNETPEVHIDPAIFEKAKAPITKMIAFSK